MAATDATVVAFTGGNADTIAWQALSIRNAAGAAGRALSSMRPVTAQIADSCRAETELADDAAELTAILRKLADDIGALRSLYL